MNSICSHKPHARHAEVVFETLLILHMLFNHQLHVQWILQLKHLLNASLHSTILPHLVSTPQPAVQWTTYCLCLSEPSTFWLAPWQRTMLSEAKVFLKCKPYATTSLPFSRDTIKDRYMLIYEIFIYVFFSSSEK